MKKGFLKRTTAIFRTLLWLGIAASFIGFAGCNNSDGTKSYANTKPADPPIYVVNGRVITGDTASSIIPLLKQKYIDALHVVPGEKAKLLFGEKAKGGAIIYQIPDEQKAFHDLRKGIESDSVQKKAPEVYDFADQQPVLKGGQKELQQKVNYPEACKQAGVKGRVLVQVVVNKQGLPKNPQIIKGLGHGCDKEALRVAKLVHFIPGKIDGEPVKVRYLLQVVFPPNVH